jgi:hypothetical protein
MTNIRVDGATAGASYSNGDRTRLRKVKGRWLIDSFSAVHRTNPNERGAFDQLGSSGGAVCKPGTFNGGRPPLKRGGRPPQSARMPSGRGVDEAVSGARTAAGFRRDIQGIRGLALVLVLLMHAEVPFAAGGYVGLDLFFVLSGFLITGLIVSEMRRTGSVSLVRFYGRRARRLLPLALTVLAFVAAGSLLLFPPVSGTVIAGDVIAACLYVVNWRFMAESVDYFADGVSVSPVRHYWSLSVEEQFYLLWPVVLLLATARARRRSRNPMPALWAAVAGIGVASLA